MIPMLQVSISNTGSESDTYSKFFLLDIILKIQVNR